MHCIIRGGVSVQVQHNFWKYWRGGRGNNTQMTGRLSTTSRWGYSPWPSPILHGTREVGCTCSHTNCCNLSGVSFCHRHNGIQICTHFTSSGQAGHASSIPSNMERRRRGVAFSIVGGGSTIMPLGDAGMNGGGDCVVFQDEESGDNSGGNGHNNWGNCWSMCVEGWSGSGSLPST